MTLQSTPVLAPQVSGPSSDGELVRRAREGDDNAAEALAQRFRQPVYCLALQLLGNPDDALDVAQDSLLNFFTTLDRFNTSRPVKPWLLTIVRNRARDLMRHHKVRNKVSLDPTGGGSTNEEAPYVPQLIDQSADPEGDARQSQLRRYLWTALGRLPTGQREILILRDYQDLSYSEIAKVLSIPIGTVMSRLHRARTSLRGHLDDEFVSGFMRRTS